MTTTAPPEYRPHDGRTKGPTHEDFAKLPREHAALVDGMVISTENFGLAIQAKFVAHLAGVPARPTSPVSPVRFKRDDHGDVLAWDVLGAAYGVGTTPAEATTDWEHEAREVYADLAANAARLHPRLTRQLEFLRAYFG